jgi:hypothetical protein
MTDRINTTDTASTDAGRPADYELLCWACDTDRDLVCGACGRDPGNRLLRAAPRALHGLLDRDGAAEVDGVPDPAVVVLAGGPAITPRGGAGTSGSAAHNRRDIMGLWILDEIPESADAFFSDVFTPEGHTVLASAIVERSACRSGLDGRIDPTLREFVRYAAVRYSATGEVSCTLALFGSGRSFPFAYRDMHETEGPDVAQCPAAILDLLTPLPTCRHEETYCRYCKADIVTVDGLWMSVDVPVIETAGPYCSATTGDGPRVHEPGGTAECETCDARDWRRRCRENLRT